jgi:hypothetical protein
MLTDDRGDVMRLHRSDGKHFGSTSGVNEWDSRSLKLFHVHWACKSNPFEVSPIAFGVIDAIERLHQAVSYSLCIELATSFGATIKYIKCIQY